MKLRTVIAVCLMALMAAAWARSKVDRDLMPNQRKSFESFLKGKEFVIQDGVYKFVANAGRDGYADEPIVRQGDSVYFDYALYPFAQSQEKLAMTNISALISGDTIINTQHWSFDPVGVKLGTSAMVAGLERGLLDCRRGDSVVLLLTSELAYGTKSVGTIAPNSAVMFSVNVLTVVK